MIALLRLHNWRLWVCISVCLCVWVFFPFKSCCYCCRRSRCKRKASMRSSFVFHFTFRVTFSANCSLLTVANPRLGKINFQNVGGREGRASPSVPNGGVSFPLTPDPKPAGPPPTPGKPGFPSTHRAQAENRHPGSEEHPPRDRPSCSGLALADLHLSVAFQCVGLSQLSYFCLPEMFFNAF